MLVLEALVNRAIDFIWIWTYFLVLISLFFLIKSTPNQPTKCVKEDRWFFVVCGIFFLCGAVGIIPVSVLTLFLWTTLLVWQRAYYRKRIEAIPSKWPYALPCLLVGVGVYFIIAMWIESQSLLIANKQIAGLLQSIWKLSEGLSPIASYNDRHLLGNVWSPILYPISLIYRVFPHLFGIYMVILVWFCAGLVWLYRTVQVLFKHDLLAAVLVLHVCFNPFIQEALFNVNPFIFVFSCFMGLFYAYVTRWWPGVYGFMGLSLLCHEYAIIVCVLFGLWLCIATQDRRLGGVIIGVSTVAGYIILNGVMPNFMMGHAVSEWVLNPGPVVRLEKMIRTWLSSPFDVIRNHFSWEQGLILFGACSPYLLVMVWSKRTMLLVIVSLMFVWSYRHPEAYFYRYHFALFALPFMYWAVIWGLWVRKRYLATRLQVSEKAVLNVVCMCLVVVCLFPTIYYRRYHPNKLGHWSWALFQELKLKQRVLWHIPTGKRLVASKACHVYQPNQLDLIDLDKFMTKLVALPVDYWYSYLSQVDVVVIRTEGRDWEASLIKELNVPEWSCLITSGTYHVYERMSDG